MKICHVIGNLSPPLDEGTSKSVVKINEKMLDKNIDSFIYTRPCEKSSDEEFDNTNVYRKDISPWNILENKRDIKKLNPDILHIHSSNPLMAIYFDKIHKNTIWTAPAFRGTEETIKLWELLCRNQKTVATSRKIAGSIPREVEVLPYGIDTDKYRCKRKPEISENPKILFMSSPKEKRGFKAAIRIVKKIKEEKNPDFHVAVREKYNRVDKAKKTLEEEGLSDISHVTGFVKDLPSYFNKMDVVLYPVKSSSGFTSPPLIALESMSCGRITVCTDVKDFLEVIDDGKDGLIYSYGEESQIANRLLNMDDRKTNEMSKKAREKIKEKFSLEKTVQRYIEIYKEIL